MLPKQRADIEAIINAIGEISKTEALSAIDEIMESDVTHPSAAPTASDRDDGAAVRTIPDVAGCIPASSSLAAVEAANVTLSTENAQLRQALRVIRKGLSDDSDGEFWPARRWLDRRDIFHGDLSGNRVLELVAKHALHGNIAMPSTGVGLKTVEYLWNNGDFDGLIAFVRELLAGNPLTTEVLSAAAASPALNESNVAVPDLLRGHDAEPRLNSAARWAVEELSKHVTMCAPDCTCEDCPQCGQDPHDCTGTDCARTCQCSYCDHCEAMEVIRAIEAALVAPLLPDATLQHVRDYLLWHQSCDGPSLIGDSRVAMDAQTRVLRRLLGWLELGDSYLDAHISLAKQQVASSSLPVSEPSGVQVREKNDSCAELIGQPIPDMAGTVPRLNNAVKEQLLSFVAHLRSITWLSPVSAEEMNRIERRHADFLEGIASHITAQPAWQSIETAPKDGTRVLVYDLNWCGTGPRQTVSAFQRHVPERCAEYCFSGVSLAKFWQPLPSLPRRRDDEID